jgi:hypothetical protein
MKYLRFPKGRVLKISYGTVDTRVKKWEENVNLPRREDSLRIVAPDGMYTYVGQKNCCRVWITFDRHGKRYIDFVCDDYSTATGIKLWEKTEDVDVSPYCADHCS